jgi:hypothetical protein
MGKHKVMDLHKKFVTMAGRLEVGLAIFDSVIAGSRMVVDGSFSDQRGLAAVCWGR